MEQVVEGASQGLFHTHKSAARAASDHLCVCVCVLVSVLLS